MTRKEELKILIEKADKMVDVVIDKIKSTRKVYSTKVVEYLSDVTPVNFTVLNILCNFHEGRTEIGFDGVEHFKYACDLYAPSYSRKKWELNYGSVGSFDKDSGYCDRTILLGVIASELKKNGELMDILNEGVNEIISLKKEKDAIGCDRLRNELEIIEHNEREKVKEDIIQKIITNGGIDMGSDFTNIYIKETSKYKSPISKIEFVKINPKTIEAVYYYSDGFTKYNYRGEKNYVLLNCFKLADAMKKEVV